jgi:hypothetical protein
MRDSSCCKLVMDRGIGGAPEGRIFGDVPVAGAPSP